MNRGAIGNAIAPLRFLVFLALLPIGYFGWRWWFPAASWQDALAIGFDAAAAVFLISLVPLLRDSSAAAMRRHASANDANRVLVLVITSILMLVVMAAISGELAEVKADEPFAMARLIVTLVAVWLFANAVYALHYAHQFYTRDTDGKTKAHKDCGGLVFPGTSTPTYLDFAYFAFTLGMTFQTSDVEIESSAFRHVALMHSLAAFVFNIGVIAFTINALSGAS